MRFESVHCMTWAYVRHHAVQWGLGLHGRAPVLFQSSSCRISMKHKTGFKTYPVVTVRGVLAMGGPSGNSPSPAPPVSTTVECLMR